MMNLVQENEENRRQLVLSLICGGRGRGLRAGRKGRVL